MRNAGLQVRLRPGRPRRSPPPTAPSPPATARGETVTFPIAHHDGNYLADAGDPRPPRGRGPRRLPLRREPQRLRRRHRRHPLAEPPRPRPDAPPRARRRSRRTAAPTAPASSPASPRRSPRAPCRALERRRRRAYGRAHEPGRSTVAPDRPPVAPPGRFWMRVGLLALRSSCMVLVIWASHAYLTRAFSEDQNADATVRATLYAGSIQSTMQRHSVVPLLLSRDPILILGAEHRPVPAAPRSGSPAFKEEIGAGSIFLLDAEGRIVAASDERPREQYDGDKAYFTARQGRPRHRLLDHRERRRRLQLPLRPPHHAGRQAARRRRRHRRPRRPRGGLAPRRASRSSSPTATTRCCSPPSRTGARRRSRTSSPRAPTRSRVRRALQEARKSFGVARLRLHRRHPAPRRRGAGRLPQLAPHLLRHARGRARPGERGPLADHHGAGAPPRARLLPALAAHPRREPPHPARVRGAPRPEPPALRRDRRPQAGGEEPQGSRAKPRAGVETRRPRPDVGRGQPRAQPAARGDEDLPRRRPAAADPPPARRRRSPPSSASTT